MLKKSRFSTLFLFISLVFSSCVEVIEEFWFSEDGSGRYAVTVDFSALLRDSVFAKRLGREVDSLRFAGGATMLDSTFLLFEKWPDSLRKRMPSPHFLREIEGQIHFDLDQKKLWKKVSFGFDSPRDFEVKMRAWRAAAGLLRPSAEGFGEPFFGAMAPKINFDGREATYFFDFSKNGNETVARAFFEKKDDPFLNGFLRSAEHRVIFHLPKKIKKWRGAGFEKTDEATLESRQKWIEMINGEPLKMWTKVNK